jgi:hypothetical protein
MQCQRDLTDKYRVTVLPDSRFELEGQQLDIGADLSHFPRPFFDSMQMTPATIAFAFGAGLSSDTLSAAALISSWLGIQADYRGVSFAALNDTLPEKNGILIGHPGEKIGGLTCRKPLSRCCKLSITRQTRFISCCWLWVRMKRHCARRPGG